MKAKILILFGVIIVISTSLFGALYFTNKNKKDIMDDIITTTSIPSGETTDELPQKIDTLRDEVTVYVFYGEGCPHCEKLFKYLEELNTESSIRGKVNVVKYEVWDNDSNLKLKQKYQEYFKQEDNGVPFYFVGSKSYTGFSDIARDKVKNAIISELNNKNYTDATKIVK